MFKKFKSYLIIFSSFFIITISHGAHYTNSLALYEEKDIPHRSHFFDMNPQGENIFKYKPDYNRTTIGDFTGNIPLSSETDNSWSGLFYRGVQSMVRAAVESIHVSTKAPEHNPVYIYMQDLNGLEENEHLKNRLITLEDCVTNSHLNTREVGNIHIYSFYKSAALLMGLKEFYSFVNKLKSYRPHCIWNRTHANWIDRISGETVAIPVAHIKLQLDFQLAQNNATERKELLHRFFRDDINNCGQIDYEIFSATENTLNNTDTDEFFDNKYTRKSGYIKPNDSSLSFLRVKVDLFQKNIHGIPTNFEELNSIIDMQQHIGPQPH